MKQGCDIIKCLDSFEELECTACELGGSKAKMLSDLVKNHRLHLRLNLPTHYIGKFVKSYFHPLPKNR